MLGAQNCHWEDESPCTGEVSARMLRGLVDYVMVGHSERRAAGETDEQIARKVAAVVGNGLTPIVFVGEDEQGGDPVAVTEQRLRHALSGSRGGRAGGLYGGTVADDNVAEFAALEVLDGMAATRASLDPERFLRMIDRSVQARR